MNSVQFKFCSEPEHRGWSWLCFSHKAVATKARTTLGACDSSMAALAKADQKSSRPGAQALEGRFSPTQIYSGKICTDLAGSRILSLFQLSHSEEALFLEVGDISFKNI